MLSAIVVMARKNVLYIQRKGTILRYINDFFLDKNRKNNSHFPFLLGKQIHERIINKIKARCGNTFELIDNYWYF
jgi:hypothetical protein